MSRLSLALVLLVGVLAGGLGVSLLSRGPEPVSDADVRSIVSEMLAADASGSQPDATAFNAMVEQYLMDDPAVLERMTTKLTAVKRAEQRDKQIALIEANHATIYDDPANVILGNPEGDVTLVELFDYNCGYCRRALPDLATLIAEDPNLRVILKEFPILSEGSVQAARVAYLVGTDDKLDYWAFHRELFNARGQIDGNVALTAAETIGADRMDLTFRMDGKAATDALERSYNLATALNISGTPTFIIGDEVIPGAVGVDTLRGKIANMRACGSTVCETTAG